MRQVETYLDMSCLIHVHMALFPDEMLGALDSWVRLAVEMLEYLVLELEWDDSLWRCTLRIAPQFFFFTRGVVSPKLQC